MSDGKTTKYTEIFKLKEMLEKANIPFGWYDNFFGSTKRESYQIQINSDIDAVEYFGSCGNDRNLLEIMGGLTVEENKIYTVLGYLTAEEVFKRFKYCYENNTSIYKKEDKSNE